MSEGAGTGRAPARDDGAPAEPPRRAGHRPVAGRWLDYLGVLPFSVFVTVFLLWPTVIVVAGAFQDAEGGRRSTTSRRPRRAAISQTFVRSIVLSASRPLLGAVLGALLAWAVAVGRRDGLLRRLVLAASGVLAQFGGVMLAFAFLATFGFNGLVTMFLHDRLGIDVFAGAAGSTAARAGRWSTPTSRSR